MNEWFANTLIVSQLVAVRLGRCTESVEDIIGLVSVDDPDDIVFSLVAIFLSESDGAD